MTYSSEIKGTNRGRSSSDFIGSLDSAIRENPIPAALVGLGILWLFAGGRNVVLGGASQAVLGGIGHATKGAGSAAYRSARAATVGVADGVKAVAESASEVGGQVTETVRNAADTIGSAFSRADEIVGEASAQATSSRLGESRDPGERLQSIAHPNGAASSFRGAQAAIEDLFARQPLVLGAVGIAIGAAIAGSLPLSESENRLMGDSADAVKDQAVKLWDETKRRGSELASKGLNEVEAQGLTPEATANAARRVATKIAGFAEKAGSDIVDRARR